MIQLRARIITPAAHLWLADTTHARQLNVVELGAVYSSKSVPGAQLAIACRASESSKSGLFVTARRAVAQSGIGDHT